MSFRSQAQGKYPPSGPRSASRARRRLRLPCAAGKEPAFVPLHHPYPDSKTTATTGIPKAPPSTALSWTDRITFVGSSLYHGQYLLYAFLGVHGSSNVRQSARRLCPFLHNYESTTFLSVQICLPCDGHDGRARAIDAPKSVVKTALFGAQGWIGDRAFVNRPVNSPCQSYSPFFTIIDPPVLACDRTGGPHSPWSQPLPRPAKSIRHV